jgi:hypothetical protein
MESQAAGNERRRVVTSTAIIVALTLGLVHYGGERLGPDAEKAFKKSGHAIVRVFKGIGHDLKRVANEDK